MNIIRCCKFDNPTAKNIYIYIDKYDNDKTSICANVSKLTFVSSG